MNKSPTSSATSFGFISICEIEGIGFCGGLLLCSQIGRPIEFHCSAPVAINRAQKILYGRTYPQYLFCEQIGLSLIQQVKKQPAMYVADRVELLALDNMINAPVVVLGSDAVEQSISDDSAKGTVEPGSFQLDDQRIWFARASSPDLSRIQSIAGSFTKSLPLDEPFERIQKAIDEAQAVAR